MSKDLDQIAKKIHAEADELLDQTGLLKILEKYGIVHVTGSYSLGLMTWRDLDIYIENSAITENDFFQLGRDIVNLLRPAKMSFRNERISKTPGLPRGLYWGIYLGDERKGAWKIDIWTTDSQGFEPVRAFGERIRERLTNTNRSLILKIKSAVWSHPRYRREFSSSDVYRAVLEHGVVDVEGFWKYVRETTGIIV